MEKILGIDLGTSSIGIALRNPDNGKRLRDQLVYFSSDIFKAGVGKNQSGEYSLAAERTKNRQSRRLKETRRRRLWATLQLLIDHNLCPMSQSSLDQWKTYDKSKNLFRKYPVEDVALDAWIKLDFNQDGKPDYSSPYQLRQELATIQLDFSSPKNRYKLGRALYHIAQRRGFKSSKGETIASQEAEQKNAININEKDIAHEMKKSEAKLSKDLCSYMEEHSLHTIGEAFAQLEDEGKRIRNSRFTAVRSQYKEEIKYIFEFQKDLDINSELFIRLTSSKKDVGTIFYKKPLRSQKGLVGKCTLEKSKTRCPISHPEYEKFRALSFLNNIKYRNDITSEWTALSQEIRDILFDSLFTKRVKSDFPFKEIREKLQSLLRISLNGDCQKELRTINYPDKTNVSGCPVIARLRNLLGDDWQNFHINGSKLRPSHSKSNPQQHLVEYSALDLWHICYESDDPEQLIEFAKQKLRWDDEMTKKFIKLWDSIGQGYAMLSLKAIRNISRMLELGFIYSDAIFFAKIPEIVNISDDEILSIVHEFQTEIKPRNKQEKLINSIVNSLIGNYKSLDIEDQFAYHDTTYTLKDDDLKEVEEQIIKFVGEKTWGLMDANEQETISQQVISKYQSFFNSTKRDFCHSELLSKALTDFLIKKFPKVEPTKWDELYHPSRIFIYKVENTTDSSGNSLRLGSPSIGAMRNPVARRTLNVLRKKINALLDAGLIDTDETRIVVETTRQLNDTNKRWAIETYQREREKENKEIHAILDELFPTREINEKDVDAARYAFEQTKPKEDNDDNSIDDKYKENKNNFFGIDVNKYRLWKEQEAICMYTGKTISISKLFDNVSFDIEHTIPRSISFDNSDQNLTLCDAHYNRSIKGNKIPTQLANYENEAEIDGEKYSPIKPRLEKWTNRVKRLKENVDFWKAQSKKAMDKPRKDLCIRQRLLWQMELDYWQAKVDRFTMTEVKEGFRNSQLVDTGIITKYAALYLKSIFRRVEVQKGSVTAEFRKILGVQSVEENKDRTKHSHHAIDATILTLIPVPAKRMRMIELFYKIEEQKRQNLQTSYNEAKLKKEIEECHLGPRPDDIVSFIESHILIQHHTNDRTFLTSKHNINYKGYISGGDSVRGRLHKETFYGAIQLPKESSSGPERVYVSHGGKFVYPERAELTIVNNVPISSFSKEEDLESIVDSRVRHSILTAIKKRMSSGLSFKQAINEPIWMLNRHGEEVKINKRGKRLCPIRHVRCKVKAGRGYMTSEKSLDIRQHTYVSTRKNINIPHKEYKQKIYAQNDTNYLFLLYEGIKRGMVDRKSRIISLWEATLLHTNNRNANIESIIRETPSYNSIIVGNIEYKLTTIIKVGDNVLLWNDNPDELRDMTIDQLSTRLYKVVKFNNTGSDVLYLHSHLSATQDVDLKLVPNKANCLFENRDFKIDSLGRIHFID